MKRFDPTSRIIAAGQPTVTDLEQLTSAGVKTVVNLRTAAEASNDPSLATVATDLGMRYEIIPVKGGEGLTRENVQRLADVLADSADGPVLVHCGSANRVGAMLALKAFWVDGQAAEDALKLGQRGGLTGLEPVVRKHLGIDGSIDTLCRED